MEEALDWLSDIPGGSESEEHSRTWTQFAAHNGPVITLFGSYDTGKSSLLRRLLIDADVSAPEWLTISARHETFESNEVALGNLVLRDTPGFAVGAQDARGQSNSRQALASVGLTDVGVAVLTPQLATSDRDLFLELFDQSWAPGTLWFVISRFDEAGIDPEHDLEAYRALSERKVSELRELFGLGPDVPVFVVAQDPFQMAGPDSDVTKSIWDDFRSWDGIDQLQHQLALTAAQPVEKWRTSAAQRYWTKTVADTVARLRDSLADCEASSKVAAEGVARRDTWESELQSLDQAALASLDGLVEAVLDQWWGGGSAASLVRVQDGIETSLTDWFTKHDGHLQRLQRTIQKTAERDHRQPSWEGFTSLVARLQAPPQPAPQAAPGVPYADHVEVVGGHVVKILKALEASGAIEGAEAKAANVAKAAKATEKTRKPTNKYTAIAEAALPLAIYIAKQIDDNNSVGVAQTSTPAPDQRQQVIDECTEQARSQWNTFVENTRQMIEAETGDQVALNSELSDAVSKLKVSIAKGEELLGRASG